MHPDQTTPDGDSLWELEEVVASQLMYDNKLYYQVSWKGWTKDEYWYPANDLKRAPHLLVQFHWENPEEVGPSQRVDFWMDAYEDNTEEGLEETGADDCPMRKREKEMWLKNWAREYATDSEGEEEEDGEGNDENEEDENEDEGE